MVTLSNEQNLQLVIDVHQAVQRACRDLLHQAAFDDRDIGIADATYDRIHREIEAGAIDWEDRKVHIGRYVSKSVTLERRGMNARYTRNGTRVWANDDYDPIDQAIDHRQDVETSLQCLEDLEILMLRQQADRAQEGRLRESIRRASQTLPDKLQARFAAVMLYTHRGNKTYEDVLKQLDEMGFEAPTPTLLRQWVKRYAEAYRAILVPYCHILGAAEAM